MPLDLDACIEKLMNKQLLVGTLIKEICEKTKELLMMESNVVHISAPVTVVAIFMGNFTICSRYFVLVAMYQTRTTCSWETMWTAASFPSKRSRY